MSAFSTCVMAILNHPFNIQPSLAHLEHCKFHYHTIHSAMTTFVVVTVVVGLHDDSIFLAMIEVR